MFKDRVDAASQLLKKLRVDPLVKKNPKNIVIISLLRGGVVIGDYLAKKLKAVHLPLVVAKIPAPFNEEFAIGAFCFDIPYLEKSTVDSLNLNKREITIQIAQSRYKFDSYTKEFNINEALYDKIKNKLVIVVDDGIATGASAKAAVLFLKTKEPAKIILASPIAPTDFKAQGFDKAIILRKDSNFKAVSQFYRNFPQVENKEVKQLLVP